jgi:hypothetical protein
LIIWLKQKGPINFLVESFILITYNLKEVFIRIKNTTANKPNINELKRYYLKINKLLLYLEFHKKSFSRSNIPI